MSRAAPPHLHSSYPLLYHGSFWLCRQTRHLFIYFQVLNLPFSLSIISCLLLCLHVHVPQHSLSYPPHHTYLHLHQIFFKFLKFQLQILIYIFLLKRINKARTDTESWQFCFMLIPAFDYLNSHCHTYIIERKSCFMHLHIIYD